MAATAGNPTSLERGPFFGPMAELFNALQHGSAPLAASLMLSGLVVMLSLVPPLFFRVMEPRLKSWDAQFA